MNLSIICNKNWFYSCTFTQKIQIVNDMKWKSFTCSTYMEKVFIFPLGKKRMGNCVNFTCRKKWLTFSYKIKQVNEFFWFTPSSWKLQCKQVHFCLPLLLNVPLYSISQLLHKKMFTLIIFKFKSKYLFWKKNVLKKTSALWDYKTLNSSDAFVREIARKKSMKTRISWKIHGKQMNT